MNVENNRLYSLIDVARIRQISQPPNQQNSGGVNQTPVTMRQALQQALESDLAGVNRNRTVRPDGFTRLQ